MGTWNTAIDGNDTFLDIYSNFFDLYNQGQSPIYISTQLVKIFVGEFEDEDTRNNALFALAFAQWETKAQAPDLLKSVQDIIATGNDLNVCANLGADEETLAQRAITLDEFLKKIATPISKAKRRIKVKFDFKLVPLIKIIAPDGLKEFTASEEYVNGKYVHTSAMLMWHSGGGGSVCYFADQGKALQAKWIDRQTLELTHEKDIVFAKKAVECYYYGDGVKIIYKVM
ncbi:hypothetical protein ACFGVS_28375 [Mucilaginibacter sp. AW1-7]|uniref:hypothetical protein n=1 Tax=Mucilaginibacter sp. AW1-7 TaxID=3349874 RepID=UPI003F73E3E4